ncbi:hypothetical protein [Glaciecola sp. 1036]|uniref:hypothetical protein n=1 Tax=Alteromonadaceae TaxID=72275 RepID=UPI003D075029
MKLMVLNQSSWRLGLSLLYWMGGALVILGAALSFFLDMSVADMLDSLNRHFGKTFSFLFIALVCLATLALKKMYEIAPVNGQAYWAEIALQAANGISTIALTFTLLGISLGIGYLSEKPLAPENVNDIISQLTSQFSMAFMTTVVGLPTAAVLRALVAVKLAKSQ